MRTSAEIIGITSTSVIPTMGKEMGPSISAGKPMVNILPFEVRLVRLTQQEILKYTQKYLPSEKLQSEPGRSSPVKTRSMRFRSLSTQGKKRIISGRLTQRLVSITSVSICRHILCRWKQKLRLKCRIKRCTLAYASFNTFKDLNTHHHIYHPNILFKCPSCGKLFATPSTWKNHKYGCTHQKLYKCKSCRKRFLFNSTLRQHNRSHTCQKLFKCFYGKCMNRYKHPQDLEQHIATHWAVKFECEMCNKSFSQKRLLKRHSVVHSNVCAHKCEYCRELFHHYNQLHRHRKKCFK